MYLLSPLRSLAHPNPALTVVLLALLDVALCKSYSVIWSPEDAHASSGGVASDLFVDQGKGFRDRSTELDDGSRPSSPVVGDVSSKQLILLMEPSSGQHKITESNQTDDDQMRKEQDQDYSDLISQGIANSRLHSFTERHRLMKKAILGRLMFGMADRSKAGEELNKLKRFYHLNKKDESAAEICIWKICPPSPRM